MAHRIGSDPFVGSLGTVFHHCRQADTILVTSDEGAEIEVPAPDLREFLDELLASDAAFPTGDYTRALELSGEHALSVEPGIRREREAAPAQAAALLGLPPEQRPKLLTVDSPYCTYEVASVLLAGARRVVHENPRSSRELAEIGRAVAEVLPAHVYGERRVAELCAYAEAVFGNALRVAGDLRGATRAFLEARCHLGGEANSPDAVEVDNLETSLRRDLRDFAGALGLSERVIERYRGAGDSRAVARALMKRAVIYENMCEPESAVEVIEEAERAVDLSEDPWLSLVLRHNRTFYLARAGRFDEAAALFEQSQRLYDRFSKPAMMARRFWAHGLIVHGREDSQSASRMLTEARAIFESHGYPVEVALVSLDLAAALAEQGRFAEVRELAAATYTLLESQGVHRDALAALAQFQQAAACEQLDREVLRQIAQRLTRAAEFRPLPA
jgi:tetratricopeptide (TPR) repeat protein